MLSSPTYAFFFQLATENPPFPYQRRLAEEPDWPQLLQIPTGLGKTAAVVLAWLWRRRFHPDPQVRLVTPRRLVYCLPMRVLVEQTQECAERWLHNLIKAEFLSEEDAPLVHLLMGGAIDNDWDERPEHEAILIGTQDQLLSRALNRGYAMNRYRWPTHFALLHNDALWVADEVQLMGVGVETTAQLQGLRNALGTFGPSETLWMSATLDERSLATIDHPVPENGLRKFALTDEEVAHPLVKQRVDSQKALRPASISLQKDNEKTYASDLASAIVEAHRPGSLTLVVLNRVQRAQEVFMALQKSCAKRGRNPALALIHARMRPRDRKAQERILFGDEAPEDRIVVATQTIEAGVDVSACTLFTELAPWSSLVQRFGRCNRYGKQPEAVIHWIDVAPDEKLSLPYAIEDLTRARNHLQGLAQAGPSALATIHDPAPPVSRHVLRRQDLLDLFDTSADLAGNDLDVSRYIREGEDTDVQVYWRDLPEAPQEALNKPTRDELCSVSIGAIRTFLKKAPAWRWDTLEMRWHEVSDRAVRPGQTLLLATRGGGYHQDLGWTGDPKHVVEAVPPSEQSSKETGMDDEPDTFNKRWVPLREHSEDVAAHLKALSFALQGDYPRIPWPSLMIAAQRHDHGKAHEAFVNMLCSRLEAGAPERQELWAKSAHGGRAKYWVRDGESRQERPGFRHELASALAWLQHADGHAEEDLIAYLIAAHHGKVRMSLRSLPNEKKPSDPERRFARGVWDGDRLPETDLGDDMVAPACMLDLSPMSLGEGPLGPSWLERTTRLRDTHGPFRLALMEMLIRVADWRASREETTRAD